MDQYWNAYSYCGADPVNYVDEWGLEGDEGVPGFSIPGYLGNNHFGDDVNVNGISPTETGPGSVNNPDQNREGPPTIVSNNSFVDNLREAYKRQQAAYGKEGVEADPFIPSPVLVAPVVGKAGKNIVKAADDVVEDVLNAGKNFADDLTKARKGGPRKSITEKPNAGKNANGSKSEMLGKNGAQTASKTMWKGKGKSRIDVENPNPGKRPGNVHVHDVDDTKYYYDPGSKTFPDAPKHINDLLKDPGFQQGIEKAINVLGK